MKIVKIDGGLGNQMFQYAFSQEIVQQTGDEILFDTILNKRWTVHNGIELEKVFNIQLSPANSNQINSLAVKPTNIIRRIQKKIFPKCTHITQKKFCFDKSVFDHSGNLYFDGFWQSEKYFYNVKEDIKNLYSFNLPLSQKNSDLLQSIKHHAAFLHIRRGDYVTSSGLNVCEPQYYYNAIDFLQKKTAIKTFLIFSDDIEWCKQTMKFPKNTVYVDWNKKENNWQDMALMTKCDHAIIANSSFSWWGAWLIKNPQKIVTVPSKWFTINNEYYKDAIDNIALPDWKRIFW